MIQGHVSDSHHRVLGVFYSVLLGFGLGRLFYSPGRGSLCPATVGPPALSVPGSHAVFVLDLHGRAGFYVEALPLLFLAYFVVRLLYVTLCSRRLLDSLPGFVVMEVATALLLTAAFMLSLMADYASMLMCISVVYVLETVFDVFNLKKSYRVLRAADRFRDISLIAVSVVRGAGFFVVLAPLLVACVSPSVFAGVLPGTALFVWLFCALSALYLISLMAVYSFQAASMIDSATSVHENPTGGRP